MDELKSVEGVARSSEGKESKKEESPAADQTVADGVSCSGEASDSLLEKGHDTNEPDDREATKDSQHEDQKSTSKENTQLMPLQRPVSNAGGAAAFSISASCLRSPNLDFDAFDHLSDATSMKQAKSYFAIVMYVVMSVISGFLQASILRSGITTFQQRSSFGFGEYALYHLRFLD